MTPISSQFVQDLIESWGGTKVLAESLHNEFQYSATASDNRLKILDLIVRLIIIEEARITEAGGG